MIREEIDEQICQIMKKHGLDRHIDSHQFLTDYVMSVIAAVCGACARTVESEGPDANAYVIAARIRSIQKLSTLKARGKKGRLI